MDTSRQARAVQAQATSVRTAIDAKEWATVTQGLPSLLSASRALETSTQGLEWRLLTSVPVLGSSASAVSDMAASLNDVAAAADPLAPFAQGLLAGELRTDSGAIDVELVAKVAPLLVRLSTSMNGAVERLHGIDPATLRPEVARPLTDLRDQLADVAPGVAAASDAAGRVPALLGADGGRTWLVLQQNPAEARGSGGLVDGYAVLTADKGRITVTSTGTRSDLAKASIPADAASAETELLWGRRLDDWNTFNASANFSLTAQLAAAGLASQGTPVSGVIGVDPVVLAAMLTATGPVTVDGVTVDASNVESYLTADIYRRYDDDAQRNEASTALMAAVLRRFLASSWDAASLIDTMQEPVRQGRVHVWSAEANEQEWLIGTGIGGELPNIPGPIVAVAFNNAAANKMDAFVGTEVHYTPGRCPNSAQQASSLSVKVRNDAPVDLPDNGEYERQDNPAAPKGSTSLLVHVYAPIGADLVSATIDGEPVQLTLGSEGQRPVWWTSVPINRDQQREVIVDFSEPTVLGVEPRVIPQPMVRDELVTITPDPTCAP